MPAASRCVQDIPPEASYNSIKVKRVTPKPFLNAKLHIGGYSAITSAAFYIG